MFCFIEWMLWCLCICLICTAALFELSGPVSTVTMDDDLLLMTPDPDPTLSHAMTQNPPEATLPAAVQWDMSQGHNMESCVPMTLPDKGISSEIASSSALRPALTFSPCSLFQTCLPALKKHSVQLFLKYPCTQNWLIPFL